MDSSAWYEVQKSSDIVLVGEQIRKLRVIKDYLKKVLTFV